MVTSQSLLKPSDGLLEASLVPRFDLWYLHIWPYSETMGCPYTWMDRLHKTHTGDKKEEFTLPNSEFVVHVIGLLLLLLEYGFGSLDVFILEAHVLCIG